MAMQSISISLQSVTKRALDIEDSIKKFSVDQAQQEAELLHQDGIQLVVGEVKSAPLFGNEVVSPVVALLNKVVASETIQHQLPFHHSLSKAYRIFVELTWYQCYRQGQLPIFKGTRDQIIKNSNQMKQVLPKSEIHTRFEYSCAQQGAKFLTPTESLWKQYLELVISSVSFSKAIKALREAVSDTGYNLLKSWYLDIHHLRWMATHAKTTQEFVLSIGEGELQRFQKEGGKHTICLAIIFMGFLTHPETDHTSKALAVTHLENLLCLQDQGWIKRFADWALEQKPDSNTFKDAARKWDPYWKSRALIVQSIQKLAEENPKYIYPPSVQTLVEENPNNHVYPIKYIYTLVEKMVSDLHFSKHNEEKKKIGAELDALKKKHVEFVDFIEETEEFLEAARGPNKAGQEEEIEQAERELKEALKDKESIESETKIIESLSAVLETLNLEEKKVLEDILSKKA